MIVGISGALYGQSEDPMPAECGGASGSEEVPNFLPNCGKTSTLWSSDSRHVPNPNARGIRVKANFIILQKIDGTGNFQDIPEHRQFLDEWLNTCNYVLANLTGPSNCTPLVTDAKVQIEPNWIFLPDPDPSEFNWNNDNNPGGFECPNFTTWWLNNLDADIRANTSIPKGINVYLTVDGSIYTEMVVLGIRNNPETPPNPMAYVWCSEQPDKTNLNRASRISVANLYLKYWWFQNTYPYGIDQPFSVTRQWLVNEGRTLAHEFGHSFIDKYVHSNYASPSSGSNCTNHLMHESWMGVSERNVLPEVDAGHIHRNLALSNLRQFIGCSESYSPTPLNQSWNSTAFDRLVVDDELWDHDMRVYSNITVKTGTTLMVTCKLLMAEQGLIKVERGAKLIVDGGAIMRANTCSPSQYWRGIAVSGNNIKLQPGLSSTLTTEDGGVIILAGQGMLEGAVVGVTTQRIPNMHEPEFWGGLLDAGDFTFQDCRKGVEFMKYDLPNNSRFQKTKFIRTSAGSSYAGVTIWDTDGILFDECTFNNMTAQGIRTIDAVFNVRRKNRISGSQTGILSGATNPLNGEILVGVLGAQGVDRNIFLNNVVGIHATANSKVNIYSNDFDSSNFGLAVNGTTSTRVKDNIFMGSAAGSQFENTGYNNLNENECNRYVSTTAGVDIFGTNTGYTFNGEDFSTLLYDLFIEGDDDSPGEPPFFQGMFSAARWNYFTSGKPEQIKTSTAAPTNVTKPFWYIHPDPSINPRLKPKCPLNESCTPQSNFYNLQTGGTLPNCNFPETPGNPSCLTRPCLEAVRNLIAENNAVNAVNPSDSLEGALQALITEREFITGELVRGYIQATRWDSVEMLLNEDLNPANWRRLVSAKLEQKQYAPADSLMQVFPLNTIHDQYFVQVQEINSVRLSNSGFTLSNEQKSTLLTIASASTPEAGYAQTLLGILADTVFMPRLPNFGIAERNSVTDYITVSPRVLEVSPNPVSDLLLVRPTQATRSQIIELRALTTNTLVQSIDVTGLESLTLSVQNLPSGIYLVVLRTQGEVVDRRKIIVQH